MKKLVFLLLFLTLSCGKSTIQETEEAIDVALSHLSEQECDKAIKVLEGIGRQNDNAVYLTTLASAYACRANFNMVSFITDDIPRLNTTAAGMLTSLATLSLSAETTTDSQTYLDIQTSVSILGTTPTQAERNEKFGARKAGDLGIQMVIMNIVGLGKFLRYYGNASATGVKGAGGATSKCFMNYTYAAAQSARAVGSVGSCTGNTLGHADLTTNKRKCEGLMLITNIIDTLPNIDLSNVDSFENISDLSAIVEDFKDIVVTVDSNLTTLMETTSVSSCETLLNGSATERNNMELIYAALLEHYFL